MGLGEVDTLKQDYRLRIDWRPFLLRPDAPETGWELPEHIRARLGRADNPLTARAAALGLTLKERVHIPSSRRAHECTEYARAQGALDAFHAAVLERYWARGEDLSAWAVLRDAAAQAGLDGAAMQAEVEAGRWRGPLEQALAEAAEVGVSAVPTFVIADRFVVQGAQEARVFRQAFQRLAALPSP